MDGRQVAPVYRRNEAMGKTILFVYGTLKRGGRNHRLIADQRFLGEAVTAPRYRLYDLGSHPGMVADAGGLAVRGELWEVNGCVLLELDDFEEVPDLFVRGPVEMVGLDGMVEAYFYNRPIPDGAGAGAEWPFEG
jgi:gamma-glutamylaminecyclotransferase